MDPMCGHSLQTGNISGMLSDNRPRPPLRILYITPEQRIVAHMKQIFFSFCIALLVGLGGPAMAADCYADYKAKQDNPLRLHYGVVEVNVQPCQMSGAVSDKVSQRVAAGGWMLLQVESVFDETGLEAKKRDAGEFYLRY